MPVHPSTRQHLEDHLSQAEFALRVAANFECVKDTPAHAAVRAALSRVAEARGWVRANHGVEAPAARTADLTALSAAEKVRTVHRRMARLAP